MRLQFGLQLERDFANKKELSFLIIENCYFYHRFIQI